MSDPSTASPARTRPPYVADERATLDGWLDFHRATFLWKCAGLSDEQLKQRSCPPSELSLLGLVRHLTEDERGWFREFAEDDVRPAYCTDEDPDADWSGVPDADAAADLATYRAEVQHVRRLLAGRDLDETRVEEGREYSLRWIYTHMIEEYARHNGHADLLREAIDEATGDF